MIVCDRCKKEEAKYKMYVGGRTYDLCSKCDKQLHEIHIIFNELEKEFMKNKTLKDIKWLWEERR